MARKAEELYFYRDGELHFYDIRTGGTVHKPIDDATKRLLTNKRQVWMHGSKRVCCALYYTEMVALNDWLLGWVDELNIPEPAKNDTVECYGNIPGLT